MAEKPVAHAARHRAEQPAENMHLQGEGDGGFFAVNPALDDFCRFIHFHQKRHGEGIDVGQGRPHEAGEDDRNGDAILF